MKASNNLSGQTGPPSETQRKLLQGIQFATNLKTLKKLVIPWEKEKQTLEEQELQKIEENLKLLQEAPETTFLSDDARETLKKLEARRRTLLLEQDNSWRLKSRATWLEKGMKTQNYSKHMKKEGKMETQSGV
jgi:hypothetical protein